MSWDNLARALYDELADELGSEGDVVRSREWWTALAEEVRQFVRERATPEGSI